MQNAQDFDEQFTLNGARIASLDEFVMTHELDDETTGLLWDLGAGEQRQVDGVGTVARVHPEMSPAARLIADVCAAGAKAVTL